MKHSKMLPSLIL